MSISLEKLKEVEIKIGEITEAEKIEGSEKLLKLKVSFGEESRQVVSGIAKTYAPEELMGRQAVFVTNLEPRQIMGLESQAMILVCSDDEGIAILEPKRKVIPGALIK